jgi:hypothetical protein
MESVICIGFFGKLGGLQGDNNEFIMCKLHFQNLMHKLVEIV